MTKKKPSLRRLLARQFIVAALLPLVAFAVLWGALTLPEAVRAMAQENEQLAMQTRSRIASLLAAPQRGMQLLAALLRADPARSCDKAMLGPALDLTQEFEAVYCVDPQGLIEEAQVRPSAGVQASDLVGMDVSQRPFFDRARTADHAVWSDTFLSPLTGRVTAVLALRAGTRLLVGELALGGLSKELAALAQADDAIVIVLDGRGRVIVHPQQQLADWQESLVNLPLVRAALDGRPGSGELVLAGQRWLAAIAPAADSGWQVLVAHPQARLYRPVLRLLGLAAVVLTLSLALAVWAALRLADREAARYRRIVALADAVVAGQGGEASGDLGSEEVYALWERLRAVMDRLQEQEQRAKRAQLDLQAVLDAATEVAVMSVDEQGVFRLFNRGAEKMLGHSAVQMVGLRSALCLHDGAEVMARATELGAPADSPEQAFEVLLAAARAGRFEFGDWNYRRADGSVLRVSLSVTALHDGAGRASGFLAVAIDQTERLRAAELELARRGAEAASQAKSEFLSRVSHELRTPMNAILGYAQLLALEALTPAQQERLRRIETAGWHLVHLIDDVLDLSRIESGGLQLSLETVDLGEAAQAALRLVAPQAEAADVSLHASLGGAAHVRADKTRLQQVLLNLLSNAIKYGHAGGSVWLSLEPGQAGWLGLAVRDDGRGMDEAQLARLFRPFDRLGLEGTAVPGTGIGLVITQRLLQLMQGRLTVSSRAGQGTVFTLWLPLAEAAELGPLPLVSDAAPPGQSADLLYVEDNAVNAGLMRELLALRPGLRLRLAADLAEARRELAERRPTLLLLDMHLPDGSALELLDWLRQRGELAGLPVLVISADATPARREAALAAGASGYLTKPLEIAQVLRSIDAALSV